MADRPQQPARVARERKSSPVKTGYLVLYNAVSTILWATILGRVLLVANVHGTKMVFPAVGEFAKWTQTLALLEVVHAAVGAFGSFIGVVRGKEIEETNWEDEIYGGSRDGWIENGYRASRKIERQILDHYTTEHTANTSSQASSAHPSSQPSCKSPAASS